MKYIARGMGIIVSKDTAETYGDLGPELVGRVSFEYQEHLIEAASSNDALWKAYQSCGDGFWLNDEYYWYFDGEPEIVTLPTDQLLLALGAPCLPGFEELLCQKS